MARFKVSSPASGSQTIEAAENSSLLKALLDAGHDVPHLCYHEAVSSYGACRLCLVEVKKGGAKRTKLTTACNYPVKEGIEVLLDTEKVQRNRKMVLELQLAHCPGVPQLRNLAEKHGVQLPDLRFEAEDDTCILCGLCERVCREAVGADAITFSQRGYRRQLEPRFGPPADDCIGCGSCAVVCPTGHIECVDTPLGRTIWGRDFDKVRCEAC